MYSKQIYSLKTMAQNSLKLHFLQGTGINRYKINRWIALNHEYTVIAKRGLIMSIRMNSINIFKFFFFNINYKLYKSIN